MKQKYYSLDNILKRNAHYNMIIGERSNGKTYACLLYGLTRYVQTGEQMAIIRRWSEDYVGKRGQALFNGLIANGEVERLTGGEWTSVYYYSGRWFLCRYDDNGKRERMEEPFAYAFAIAAMEHDKSTNYDGITTCVFDEFLTRRAYLPDEFVLFMNTLSTIIRGRENVKIFMLGNTVNKTSPYFQEMGLNHIKDMKPNSIDVYTYGDSGLSVAVEFTGNTNKVKASDVYFAFDNPKLSMITGKGDVWEMSVYPHKPCSFRPMDIVFTFFILFDGDILQGEIVAVDDLIFLYLHRKTSELKRPDRDLIYSPDYDPRPNWRRFITKPFTAIERRILQLIDMDKVYFQDNSIGEIWRNYMQFCGRSI